MGTTQSAVAGLESDRSSPRVATVERALRACGQELTLAAAPKNSSIDETLVAQRLLIPPGQRIKALEQGYAEVRQIALAGARSRGELA
jgi:transcriptional regulator with XRE-family HTH domain